MGLGELADALDALEAGVALVGVEDLRLRGAGQRAVGPHGPHAADAQQHLLAQPVVLAAAVEPVGDPALGRGVLLDVAVEQQQRHPADLHAPDVGVQGAPLGQRHRDDHRVALGVAQQLQRQAVRVQRGVVLELPAVGRQALGEVAGPVQQAQADQRDAEVGGRLEVVTGEDAQAAGVVGQHLGDAELGGEVGDRRRGGVAEGLVPVRGVEVVLQVVGDVGEPAQELAVLGERGQPLRRDLPEHPDRVVAAADPQVGVDGLEQVARLGVPGPAQVHHQRGQGEQRLGERCADGESSECSHAASLSTRSDVPAAPDRPAEVPRPMCPPPPAPIA